MKIMKKDHLSSVGKIILVIILCFNVSNSICQEVMEVSKFRETIFPMIIKYRLEEALKIYDTFNKNDTEVVAARSIIYTLMGNRDDNKAFMEKGFNMLEPFLQIKEDYNIHAALALSYGVQANHAGLSDQAKLAQLSVNHSKEALKLNPNLPHPNFIIGRFYFELSDMNWITAQAARAFIDSDEIDRASFELALSYLERASELAPSRFLYNYYTGAAYMELENEEKAIQYFKMADGNERYTEDDREADEDLQDELEDLEN